MKKLVILLASMLFIVFICPAQIKISIDPTKIKKKKDQKETMDESYYTSEFHKKVAPKIVFFKTPLEAGKETDENTCSSFTSNDNIYGRALLNKTLGKVSEEYGGGAYNYGFRMYFDKDPQVGDNWKKPDAEYLKLEYDFNLETRSSTRVDIIAAPGKFTNEDMANTFKNKLASLSNGKHTIYFYMLAKKEKIKDLAFGSFELDWTGVVSENEKVKINNPEKKEVLGDFKLNNEYEKEDNWFVKGYNEDNEVLFCRYIDERCDKIGNQMKGFTSGGRIVNPQDKDVKWFYREMSELSVNKMKYWTDKARDIKKWKLEPDEWHKLGEKADWYINKMPAEFDKNFKDNKLINNINQIIDLGDAAVKAAKNNEAIIYISNAKLICDAIRLIVPDQSDINDVYPVIQKYMDKFNAEKDKIYTSPLHKKYKTKILFSKTPIKVKQENESAFAYEFTGNDNIYAIAFGDGTFEELLDNQNITSFGVHVFIDGNEASETQAISECVLKFLPKDIGKKSYLEFEIVPDLAITAYPDASKIIAKILGNTSARKHTIKIQLSNKAGVAEGEFKIDLGEGQDRIKALEAKFIDAAINLARLPKPEAYNLALENQILALSRASADFTSYGDYPMRSVVRQSWSDEKDDFGNIQWRSVYAYMAFKMKNGSCRVCDVKVVQDWLGGGKYGATRFFRRFEGSGDYDIKCENVFK